MRTIEPMTIDFNVGDLFKEIDEEALRIQQGYTGPENHWFFSFRGAMHGLSSRLYGAKLHYNYLHSWLPFRQTMTDAEYHLANTLFNMDSSLECLVFALNALGTSQNVAHFFDITNKETLKKITSSNVIGKASLRGYDTYFPQFKACWSRNTTLINAIIEYHDVIKHRHALAGAGQLRSDPPPGLLDGIEENHRFTFPPFEEIILGPDTKKPLDQRYTNWQNEPYATLEQVMAGFKPLIEESLELVLNDIKFL
jgi:hypothetical protein